MARHIASAEDAWFRCVVTREVGEWPPPFGCEDYPSVTSIKALLSKVHARTDAYLSTLDATDPDQVVELPWGGEVPLRWVIWHVLEHEIHHRGEIFLMLGLLGKEAPDV